MYRVLFVLFLSLFFLHCKTQEDRSPRSIATNAKFLISSTSKRKNYLKSENFCSRARSIKHDHPFVKKKKRVFPPTQLRYSQFFRMNLATKKKSKMALFYSIKSSSTTLNHSISSQKLGLIHLRVQKLRNEYNNQLGSYSQSKIKKFAQRKKLLLGGL